MSQFMIERKSFAHSDTTFTQPADQVYKLLCLCVFVFVVPPTVYCLLFRCYTLWCRISRYRKLTDLLGKLQLASW